MPGGLKPERDISFEIYDSRILATAGCWLQIYRSIGCCVDWYFFYMASTKHNHFYRAAFSERLRAALIGCGIPPHSPARVADAYNQASGIDPVSHQAVRKWLIGEAIPSQGKLIALSRWLGVSAEWLSFGTGGPVQVSNGASEQNLNQHKLVVVAPEHVQLIPLINRILQLDQRDQSLIDGMVRLMLESRK